MLLERFKNAVSQRVATYISERKPDTAYEAAVMADEFSLIHKTSFGYKNIGENFQKESGYDPSRSSKFLHSSPDRQRFVFGEKEKVNMCNFCHGFGHWKNECPLLKARDIAKTKSKSSVKPVVLAVMLQKWIVCRRVVRNVFQHSLHLLQMVLWDWLILRKMYQSKFSVTPDRQKPLS